MCTMSQYFQILQEPPPLCDFEEWIDTEISESNKEALKADEEFWAEWRRRRDERTLYEEEQKKRREEEKRRIAAKRKAEREAKLERARRAKAAVEENPDALRKGKWPRCTQ